MQLFGAPTYPLEVLAIDIGGTKMAIALVSGSGEVQWSERSPTPQRRHRGRDLGTLVEQLVAAVPAGTSPAGCGVGCGGPMSHHGEEVSPLNIPGWRDFPLRARVAELTGPPDVGGQRRQGPGVGRRLGRRSRRALPTICRWSCPLA